MLTSGLRRGLPTFEDGDPAVYGGYFLLTESDAADVADWIQHSDPWSSIPPYATPLPTLLKDTETFSDFFTAAATAGWTGPLVPGIRRPLEARHRWVIGEAEALMTSWMSSLGFARTICVNTP